jgi:hypothetical protein
LTDDRSTGKTSYQQDSPRRSRRTKTGEPAVPLRSIRMFISGRLPWEIKRGRNPTGSKPHHRKDPFVRFLNGAIRTPTNIPMPGCTACSKRPSTWPTITLKRPSTTGAGQSSSIGRPRWFLPEHVTAICRIVGDENVSAKSYDRLKYATGKTLEESLRLRQGEVQAVSDLVVHPRHKEDVRRLVAYCDRQRIPVVVYGGGSSVNFGLRPAKGGITLVMGTHMNRVVRLNETNQTATVQAGIMGPDYEAALNEAPGRFHARRRYTCGHFPQSFEYSTVGGWVVTLGSGQMSSYYGDAGDLVISQEVVTPAGDLKTLDFPATANGPSVNRMLIGSEGCFGVLVEVTLKIFRICRRIGAISALSFLPGKRRWTRGAKFHRASSACRPSFASPTRKRPTSG